MLEPTLGASVREHAHEPPPRDSGVHWKRTHFELFLRTPVGDRTGPSEGAHQPLAGSLSPD